MFKNLVYLFLNFLIILSCNYKNQEHKFIKLGLSTPPKINILGKLISVDKFVMPGKMVIKDSILFILDENFDKNIHIVDVKNENYLSSIGNIGKGPGETLSGISLDFFNNQVWLHDITLSKLVSYNLDSIMSDKNINYSYTKEIVFKDRARQNFNPLWLNDSTLVSTTFSESENRLMYTNTDGGIFREEFKMINPEKKNTPRSVHNTSYQSIFKIHPNKEKIAIVNRYSDLLEIYNLKNGESLYLKTHLDFYPIYEVVNTDDGGVTMVQDDTTRFGCIDISVTEDKIFTLYSGRTRGEGLANYANKIYVYDWEGKYLTSYRIPNVAIAILAKDNQTLFTSEYNRKGEGMIKKYHLNEE